MHLLRSGLDVLDAIEDARLDVAEVLVVDAPTGGQRLHQPVDLQAKTFNFKLSGMKFTTRILMSLVKIMLCGELHRQQVFKLTVFSCKIQPTSPPPAPARRPCLIVPGQMVPVCHPVCQ